MADKKITELVQIDTISSGDVFPIVDISDNITKKIDITQIKAQSPVQSVNSNIGAVVLTKTDIGLSNVDNTSDANKPVSTAQQTALNLRVPYTGATSDVNLGEFGVQLGNIEFDTTPTNVPTTEGSLNWNDTDGTLDLKLKGGNVTLQVGQEQVVRVVNKTATSINLLEANYQAVRITGAIGQRAKVDLAQATNDVLSAETIGLVTETINNNQEGFITTSGLVRGINTTGSIQGETWADGDILYLSPTTAGSVTKVKPTAPNHLIVIGYVIYAHITQGTIFVKVDNGYELDELHNVKITTAANNNVLAYTSATDIWENKTVETALGFTPVVANSAITGATKTKITYDAKGLVTAGADATTADIADSTNKRYVTDAQSTVIGNTSGTNTGDNAVNSLYSGLAASKQDALTLTTTGTSGAATLIGATLNIPQYSGGGGGVTWGSITGTLSSQTDLQTALDAKVDENAAITGATKTKITYDAKGLVTAGADATTADIADSTNKRYVTDANLTVIGNTSGTNSGNQTLANTSDPTSHTLTLSATGGSVQLVEGSGITLTTTGTTADGIITIASTGGGGGSGTVTNVSALTLGTTGSDLSSTVANSTTTPVITLNVPNASAANRGALTSTDWSTFNGKQATLVSGTSIKTVNSTSLLGSGDVAVQATLVSGTNIKTINGSTILGSGNLTVTSSPSGVSGAVQFSDGSALSSDATNFFWDNTNDRLGIGTNTPADKLTILGNTTSSITAALRNTNANGDTRITLKNDTTGAVGVQVTGSTYFGAPAAYFFTQGGLASMGFSTDGDLAAGGSGFITFSTGGYSASQERMRILAAGNIGINSTTATSKIYIKGGGATSATSTLNCVDSASNSLLLIKDDGSINLGATNTASGTTGNRTINKASGTVNIAAAGTTVTVTNSIVSAASIVMAVVRTNDTTAYIKNVVPSAGSFVITLGAAATAEVSIGFMVIN